MENLFPAETLMVKYMCRLIAVLFVYCLVQLTTLACGEEIKEKPELKLFPTNDKCYLLVIPTEFMGGEAYSKGLIVQSPGEKILATSYLQTWDSEESTVEVKLLETEFCIDNDYLDHSEIVLRYGTVTSFCSSQEYLYTNLRQYIQSRIINLYKNRSE